jgi:hypothetical protein
LRVVLPNAERRAVKLAGDAGGRIELTR